MIARRPAMPSLLADGPAREWSADADGAHGDLVPRSRMAGPVTWVIAIMVALTVIAAAGGLALGSAVRAAQVELSGGITVQIVEARADVRRQKARDAVAILHALPMVASVRLVPDEEVDRLVAPWLGDAVAGQADVPVPALIDARLRGSTSAERLRAVSAALERRIAGAQVDAQATWLRPVFATLRSLQWLALALVVLLAVATAAAVLLAVRTALGANRDTIEIVHFLGGTDSQIARLFQRSIGIDAAIGGALGLAAGGAVVFLLGRSFATLGAGIAAGGALGLVDWGVIALVPVAGALLAMVTARISVLRALKRMV